jgi:ankyrin repeat protein/predicted amidophosphoribosyltransferase
MWGKIIGKLINSIFRPIGTLAGTAAGQSIDHKNEHPTSLTSNDSAKVALKLTSPPKLQFLHLPGPYVIDTNEIAITIYYPIRHSYHSPGSFSEALLTWKKDQSVVFSQYSVEKMKNLLSLLKWESIDVIVTPPSSSAIHQIASNLAKEINAQAPSGYIFKKRPVRKQHGLSRLERQQNVRGAFGARLTPSVRGKNVLIVDDVRTSGATISEVKRVLQLQGARNVYALCMAQTFQIPWPYQGLKMKQHKQAPSIGEDVPSRTSITTTSSMSHVSVPSKLNAPTPRVLPGDSLARAREMIDAVKADDLESVRTLISKGYDVNCTSQSGNTPLVYAVRNGNLEMVKLLLAAKANANVRIQDGTTLLSYIILKRYQAIFDIVVEACDPNFHNENGVSPLMSAANKGAETCVQKLLHMGADPNHVDNQGHNVLMYAVKVPSIMRILIDAGAHVNHRNQNGDSVLAFAVYTGNMTAVQVLLDAGCLIDRKSVELAKRHLNFTDVQLMMKIYDDQYPKWHPPKHQIVHIPATTHSSASKLATSVSIYEPKNHNDNVCPSCGQPIRYGMYCRCTD